MTLKETNKITGEYVEYELDSLRQIIDAYKSAAEYERIAKKIKETIKKDLDKYLDVHGRSEEFNGYQFKTFTTQRKTYDKSVLREVLDADTYDLFMKPEKTKIDNYIKENIETLKDKSTLLRASMVDDGVPYQSVRLERLDSIGLDSLRLLMKQ